MKNRIRLLAGLLSLLLLFTSMPVMAAAGETETFVPTKKAKDGTLVGDVNKNNAVDATDRMLLARYLAGWKGYEEKIKSKEAADIDRDGDITAKDRMLLARFLAGWDGYEEWFTASEDLKNIEEFGMELAKLINEYKDKVDTSGLSKDDIEAGNTSGRVLVSSDKELPSLSAFEPAAVIDDGAGFIVIQFLSATNALKCVEYLNKQSGIDFAEIDRIVTGYADTASQASGIEEPLSWGVKAIGADKYAAKLVEEGKTGTIIVAVVDSGVDANHSFLSGRVLSGYDFVEGDNTPQDGHGHGTHVSGTVVDCTPGLAVKILPVRVLDNNGSGYSSSVTAGILYSVILGAKVINLSLGGGHSGAIDAAVAYAVDRDVVVVQAAGNDNHDTIESCPAHINEGITVSAVDSNLNKASFSNHGLAIDIAAPGVGINSCLPNEQYASWNGTSMAAPHVSAAAAMLLLGNPALSPSEVEITLKEYATDIGDSGWDRYYGAGLLDLAEVNDNFGVENGNIIDKGQCGDTLYWRLFDDGLLELYGYGDMWDYEIIYEPWGEHDYFAVDNNAPWNKYATLLKSLKLNKGITKIGYNAFNFLSKDSWTGFFGSLIIPQGVTAIGDNAFRGCPNISGSLIIPNSVKLIGSYAFSACAITSSWFYGDAPEVGSSIFGHRGDDFVIYYIKTKSGWSIDGGKWNGYMTAVFEQ